MLAEELGEEEAEGGSEAIKLAAEEVVRGGVGGFVGKGKFGWMEEEWDPVLCKSW